MMVIVLSGHGYKCDNPSSFQLPKGFILYFWTREGIEIRARVAGEVEGNPDAADLRLAVKTISRSSLCPNYWLMDPSDPPLTIHAPPQPPHIQYVPSVGDYWSLSDIMADANVNGFGNLNNPVAVHWCACRSDKKKIAWEQSLRTKVYFSKT